MIVIVMGVAGVGKTTLGQLLAAELGWKFLDADSLHPPANVIKMTNGVLLDDADRAPWLFAVHERLLEALRKQESLVVACSALKQRYRETIARGIAIMWVYLKGTKEVIHERLKLRRDHFMKVQMLASQLADLQEPTDAIVTDAAREPAAAVRQIATVVHGMTARNPTTPTGSGA